MHASRWTEASDGSWQDQALCALPKYRDLLWFPDEEERRHYRIKGRKKVIAVCAECPVAKECRQYAESIPVAAGVWAGKQYYPQFGRDRGH